MSQLPPGFPEFKRGEPVSLEEMERLADYAHGHARRAGLGGPISAHPGTYLAYALPAFRFGFWARLTAASTPYFSFQEVSWTGTEWQARDDGLSGDFEAREFNDHAVPADPTTGAVVWMWLSDALPDAGPVFVFAYEAAGGAIEVKEADGAPDYTGVTLLLVNQADGLTLTQPAAGQAQINLASASLTQKGAVDGGAQSWGGVKYVKDGLTWGIAGTSWAGFLTTQLGPSSSTALNVELQDQGAGYTAGFKLRRDPSTGQVRFYVTDTQHSASGFFCGFGLNDASGYFDGGSATTGGLTFQGGLYISGTFSGPVTITSGTTPVSGGANPGVITVVGGVIVSAGSLPPSLGGTGSDLSATGGPGQVLRQSTPGGNVTVGPAPAPPLATQVLWGVD